MAFMFMPCRLPARAAILPPPLLFLGDLPESGVSGSLWDCFCIAAIFAPIPSLLDILPGDLVCCTTGAFPLFWDACWSAAIRAAIPPPLFPVVLEALSDIALRSKIIDDEAVGQK
eukprot:CAMPEP_0172499398 /NCGR_PEP_ID=MMETSP1066-20121228/126754_1 /TAXON_ID=671091 /ORGANISM="Coscinodiscus wailesii, Strain CCMP2513" /LENGTH=114 /DNA_ID=CAMNT_0013273127 /DNA_START=318 /DNA_END=662 /DNA_ORIENTATION=-